MTPIDFLSLAACLANVAWMALNVLWSQRLQRRGELHHEMARINALNALEVHVLAQIRDRNRIIFIGPQGRA